MFNSIKEILYTNTSLTGKAPNCNVFGINNTNGALYYRDNTGYWKLVPSTGSGGGGTISLTTIGSASNINGASLTGNVLNLQPASQNYGGVINTSNQFIGSGDKYFTGKVGLMGLSSPSIDLQTGEFGLQKGTTPVAGTIRFGDKSGWRLNFGAREDGGGNVYTQDNGVYVTITDSGRLGILTTTPDTNLHVVGNTKITGLGGSGSMMVVTDNVGFLSTLPIPSFPSITFDPIGVIPNANGASVSASILTLQPASGSFGGVMSATSQFFGGQKTFDSQIKANKLSVGSSAIGSSNILDISSTGTVRVGVFTLDDPIVNNSRVIHTAYYGTTEGTSLGWRWGLNTSLQNTLDYTIDEVGNPAAGAFVNRFRIQKNTGYVAIGGNNTTNIPTHPLTVFGNTKVNGSVLVRDLFGLQTNNPTSSFQSLGSFALSYGTTQTNTILGGIDFTANCTNPVTVNLPSASNMLGRIYVVKNSSSGAVAIVPNFGDTIDGLPNKILTNTTDSVILQSDGISNWNILADKALAVSGNNFADEETPSGTINGINTTFTLVNTPIAGSVKLYKGIRMKLGVDYTISGTTITMINIPLIGEIMVADYRY